MAISDFFHCENIQDRAVESHRFVTLLAKAQLVGNYFKFPNRIHVGGEVLEHNYWSCSNHNQILLRKDADIFGLPWMIDGATIYHMPLVNNLVICADVLPEILNIHDCKDHMAVWGKKYAEYLDGVMEEEMFKFDLERMHTDVFYFDGAANVQKGGLRLCVLYTRAYLFHGREHVISLFFSDIEKIAPNKVRMCALIFCLFLYDYFALSHFEPFADVNS